MRQPPPAARDVARFLLELEAESADSGNTPAVIAERAFEKLRQSLAKFVGTAGYHALLGRALSQSKAEIHWLQMVQVCPLGKLGGFSEALTQQSPTEAANGSSNLLAHLLALLMTFVGQDLTLQLVRDVYPSASLYNIYPRAEETA